MDITLYNNYIVWMSVQKLDKLCDRGLRKEIDMI